MSELVSRPYKPDPEWCCEACVFGRGDHSIWCDLAGLRCEQQDERYSECGARAVAVCLDWGMAMCADHVRQCEEREHVIRAIA